MKSIALISILLILTGCISTKTVYISESEKVESITHNGVEGYFIPKHKMIQLTEEHIKYKAYLKKYGPIN